MEELNKMLKAAYEKACQLSTKARPADDLFREALEQLIDDEDIQFEIVGVDEDEE